MSYVLVVEIEHKKKNNKGFDSRSFTTEAFGPFETMQAAWDYAITHRSEEQHPMDYAHEVLELQAVTGELDD